MTRLFVAVEDTLAVMTRANGTWHVDEQLNGLHPYCLAADPERPEAVYCGTFGNGLFRSTDAGASWKPVGEGIPYREVMSVAASPLERANGEAVIWAGTEPSALFRSEDGGQTWQERPNLRTLPSSSTWSFPPRPWTHHVRWIAPDPVEEERIFVGIELGGVMRSLDGGATWEDRKPNSQHDSHTLATHLAAPGRVYEAAGGGYAESADGGATWRRDDAGMQHHYTWGLAVDPGDPSTYVVSASHSARHSHNLASAETAVYRKSNGAPWQAITDGLPDPQGTLAIVFATNRTQPGTFYAATNHGLFHSSDAGAHWEPLAIHWPEPYRQHEPRAIVVTE
jgi:hypothetical protein